MAALVFVSTPCCSHRLQPFFPSHLTIPTTYTRSLCFLPRGTSPNFTILKSVHNHRKHSLIAEQKFSSLITPRSYASTEIAASSSNSAVFGDKKELSAIQSFIDRLPSKIRVSICIVVILSSVAGGYILGFNLGKSNAAAIGGALVLGAFGAGAAYVLKSLTPQVAAVKLQNYLAGCDDPTSVTKEDVDRITERYSISRQESAFIAEICDLYNRFISSVLPSGSRDLKGDEVEQIVKFKNAIGIDDPDAASIHVEIGRQIFRKKLETGDRDAGIEQWRAFQKLIYISSLVFGEAATFLLPWKRLFRVTDSQVELAIRDNAQRLYAQKIKSVDMDIQVEQLVNLRKSQFSYNLSDQLAESVFKDHTRILIEKNISAALRIQKSRADTGNEAKQVASELDKILVFNDLLHSLKNHQNVNEFALGLDQVSLAGGYYEGGKKMDDLKLLYRTYATDALSNGIIEQNKLNSLNGLRNIFGLSEEEAEAMRMDVTSKVYRKRLAQSVSNGTLEAAESKAAFLQNICDELHFDPQKASKVHEEIYRHKLQGSLADGELGEKDIASLLRIRVMLCIPQQTVETAHSDICGSLFEKVVKEAVSAGMDDYDGELRKSARKAVEGLRLSKEAAFAITSKVLRQAFMSFVKLSHAASKNNDIAKELKKLIMFNSAVATQLVADIKGNPAMVEPKEEEKEEKEEQKKPGEENRGWESLKTLQKARAGKEGPPGSRNPFQLEVTLRDELPLRSREELYMAYLTFCVTGEVMTIAFGAEVTTKRDDSEFIALNQLGGILGLTEDQVVAVHQGLAEKTFSKQVEVILADGQLTKPKVRQMYEAQEEIGLPHFYAQKVIKAITTTRLASALESAVSRGRLDLNQIRELKDSNIDLDSMVSLPLREGLLKKTIDGIFSAGTGDFDEDEVYTRIPSDLLIDPERARAVVHERARSRLSGSLVQAVALLRQRNEPGVVSSLNDMLACDKALPSEPMSWEIVEEMEDLYVIFVRKGAEKGRLCRLQYLLGISASTAAELELDKGKKPSPSAAVDEEFVF